MLKLRFNQQYSAISDSTRYVGRIVSVGKISGTDLVAEAAEDSTISKATMYAAATAIALQFQEMLLRGYAVELPGVGTFRVSANVNAKSSLDDSSADDITRRRIIYTPSVDLKGELYATSITTEYGNDTSGVYRTRSAYAAALGLSDTEDADTDATDD